MTAAVAEGEAAAGNGAMPGGMSAARWRTWLVAMSVVAAGIAWKTLYAEAPGTRGLVLFLGATTACAGLCLYLWNGWPLRERAEAYRELEARPAAGGPVPERHMFNPSWSEPEADEAPRAPDAAPFARFGSFTEKSESVGETFGTDINDRPHTEWLSARREATELLASPQAAVSAECYLEWESAERPCKIPLKAESLVIGRSRDAAQHVDDSGGHIQSAFGDAATARKVARQRFGFPQRKLAQRKSDGALRSLSARSGRLPPDGRFDLPVPRAKRAASGIVR
ncbi:hypothetical protein [Cohnella rhizosphaerae]|uniref:Uncharacterized protein n=1 Tax=Cohnella rhizosphaerae TaxID=1457232 RepID=A0A9X4KPF7_9BACL|nr:hypothetical protein [Cohnella rhizosphaerae]MDG0808337.1 hypothetical protein [Cohnella rhizosphaerae]